MRPLHQALVESINTHLINPKTGLYYLNIDLNGNIHTDVTADEVYPVMFEVAPDAVAYRIIARLNTPDFSTDAGIRTVSRMSPGYDSYRQWGLMGGVWPGVAWWYAYAARKYHPEFMAQALRTSFEHYARDPKRNNTVPGQFSEWMDGESLANQGMRLSPWEPPRFVWTAIHGIWGFAARTGRLTFHPHLPAEWKWLGMRRWLIHGREVTCFCARQPDGKHVFATCDVEMGQPVQKQLYEEDVTSNVSCRHPLIQKVAFKKPGELLVCLGSSAPQTMLFPVRLDHLLEPDKTYQAEIYSSAWHRWITGERGPGEKLEEAAVQIEAGGHRLLRFREQGV